MDKYLLVVLAFMIVGIPIAFFEPSDGTLRDPPLFLLFWASVGGICVIVVYGSYKDRQQRKKENRERRRRSKK